MIRRAIGLFVCLLLCVGGPIAYTQVMMRIGSGTPPVMATPDKQADMIVVNKGARTLTLLQNGTPIRVYKVSLGARPEGHKSQEGDERTPEGTYLIDWRNANSIAHLSLHISYPNEADADQAAARGVSPGGNIMIHGLLNGWGGLGGLHRIWDWTNGCIAVTNEEMQEIWALVPTGTPIRIDA